MAGSAHTAPGWSPAAGMGSKTSPSPTVSHGTAAGSGAHGAWLETSVISAITGAWPGASSLRCRAASVYWSGTGAQLNGGPR